MTAVSRVWIDLERSLRNLVAHCETDCDHGTCGLQAFDFSPIHLASFLKRDHEAFQDTPKRFAADLCAELRVLEARHGRDSATPGVAIRDLGEQLDGDQVSDLVAEILDGLDRAVFLLEVETRLTKRQGAVPARRAAT